MSFASESRERTRPVLPLSAMVDILFLLLIFFMTASVFREADTQIPVALPVADQSQPGDANAAKLRISFDSNGNVFLGEHRIELDQLQSTLRQLAADVPDQIVEIRGDQHGDYGLAVRLMDLARSAGLTDIRLATVKPRSQAGQ